ncbi:LAGLIDADG family homing endonuclease [Oceanobacillus sp. CF4.6]|uniref:LAGLIDADG family homing endonuclease n=1 Tax=Oceanobacillus sp. CF4.6 TaxID=3373080 RepID=UPI003EE65BA1
MDESKNKVRKRTLSTDEIIRLYKEGYSTVDIGKRANVSARYINLLLKENNIERRPRGSWKRIYQLNEHYFKTWTNNMAYILGFFIADGTVARESQFISFAQKEKYILESIRKEIGSEQPLYQNKKTGVYILTLNSKIMKEDIMTIHGIMPNKSSDVGFPEVPEKYLSHFVRGYFDGDGYINYAKYTVTFVGRSETFMNYFIRVLEEQGFNPQFVMEKNHYRVHIRGRKSIKLFSEWIYKDTEAGFYLERKHATFNKEKLTSDFLTDRKDIVTREAVAKRKLYFLVIFTVLKSENQTCDYLGIKIATFKRWYRDDQLFRHNFLVIEEEQE